MVLRIAFVGSGAVNFGEPESGVPWDHARRIEELSEKYPLEIVGIADPLVDKAEMVLKVRQGQPDRRKAALYSKCKVFGDYRRMLSEIKIDAIWLGVPPSAHGSLADGKRIELDIIKAGIAVLIEKPISVAPYEEVQTYAQELEAAKGAANLPISVGYMFRYSKVMNAVKELIDRHGNGKIWTFNARYNAAYTAIPHRFWWMVSRSGGPIVEQATHFVDLARFFGGEMDYGTLTGVSIPSSDPSGLGNLKKVPMAVEELTIAPEDRIPRATIAAWKFRSGALGSLTHALLLQGKAYEASISIWADGLSIEVENPYSDCPRLKVKVGDDDVVKIMEFPGDDMYKSEDEAFLHAIATGDLSRIQSTYQDALCTYTATCKIKACTAGT